MKRDLAELISKAIDYKLAMLRVSMPAAVQAYDPTQKTVIVQPCVSSAVDLDDGPLVETLPMLMDVPVEFPRGGGYVLMFPINPGDTGMLEFTDFSIDLWRATGVNGPPGDLRTHAIGNAVFRPGLSPVTNPLTLVPLGAFLGSETGPGVHITAAGVELGGTPAVPPLDSASLAQPTESRIAALEGALAALITQYNLHMHATAALGPPVVTVALASPFVAVATPVAATKVKVV